ncbi:universal stress protein [Halopenitus persicus]|uniref:universal stress protein n=1 Tax=Halopenitus persicus TaxID=1048396 RepID=UPI000BBA902A|nr:universal stress protein [Halopenitus persicus]
MSILVPVREDAHSKNTIPLGYDLAKKYDEKLVALHVIPQKEFEEYKKSLTEISEFDDYSFTQEASKAKTIAKQIVEIHLDEFDSTRIETRGRVGDRAEEILLEADELDPRFMVAGGRRKSPVGKALFGSTTQEILLSSENPVVTTMQD